MDIRQFIRDIADFPKPGIVFKDITPLLSNQEAFQYTLSLMQSGFEKAAASSEVVKVAGIESRGFIFAAALAAKYNLGLTLIRKPGKLPYETIREEYALEYGTDILEMHKDAVANGEKIWLVDDLLATGGTSEAATRLIRKLGGEVALLSFVIELEFLEGRKKLSEYNVDSLLKY